MNFSEAKTILNECVRHELRDHAFGDREVYWERGPEETVAEGYFGSGSASVVIYGPPYKDSGEPANGEYDVEFRGDEALELSRCGQRGAVERNDSTGPDDYREGRCAPGLTLEGVRRELCGK